MTRRVGGDEVLLESRRGDVTDPGQIQIVGELSDGSEVMLRDPATTDPATTILSSIGRNGRKGSPYGDGDAAEIIARTIAAITS